MPYKEDMSNYGDGSGGVYTFNSLPVASHLRIGEYMIEDIQLVQFFLRQFFKSRKDLYTKLPKAKIETGHFEIDGKCGKRTTAGIVEFQSFCQKLGFHVKVDGIVDAPKKGAKGMTGFFYTIGGMNNWFRHFGEGREHHGNLQNHPDIKTFAPQLCNWLTIDNEAEDRF